MEFVARKSKHVRDTKRQAPDAGLLECVAAVGVGSEDPNPFHRHLPKEHRAFLSIRPIPWDRSDADRLHTSGDSGIGLRRAARSDLEVQAQADDEAS
jgi:hypothetical protein